MAQENFDFPADGSDSVLPNPKEWVEAMADPAHREMTGKGIAIVRQAFKQATGQTPVIDAPAEPELPKPSDKTS